MDKILINKRVLEAINFVINQKKVTKTALADIFEIKPAKFSEILKERMNAGVDIMAILCDAYNISAEWLLLGIGNMIKPETTSERVETPPEYHSNDLITPLLDRIEAQAYKIAQLEIEIKSLRESPNKAL